MHSNRDFKGQLKNSLYKKKYLSTLFSRSSLSTLYYIYSLPFPKWVASVLIGTNSGANFTSHLTYSQRKGMTSRDVLDRTANRISAAREKGIPLRTRSQICFSLFRSNLFSSSMYGGELQLLLYIFRSKFGCLSLVVWCRQFNTSRSEQTNLSLKVSDNYFTLLAKWVANCDKRDNISHNFVSYNTW